MKALNKHEASLMVSVSLTKGSFTYTILDFFFFNILEVFASGTVHGSKIQNELKVGFVCLFLESGRTIVKEKKMGTGETSRMPGLQAHSQISLLAKATCENGEWRTWKSIPLKLSLLLCF